MRFTKVRNIIIFSVIYLYFFVFRFFVIPSADDYFWNDSRGMYLFRHGFFSRIAQYDGSSNGRYLGNTLEIFMEHHLLLAMFIFAFFWTLLIWSMWSLLRRTNFALIISILFVFSMQIGYINNMLVWNAGFVNYVPAAALLLAYLAMVRDGTRIDFQHPNLIATISLLIGISGGLFVEHMTIYQVMVGFLVIFLMKILHQGKLQRFHLTYLLGAIIGAAIMFSNPSYRTPSNYRKAGFVPYLALRNYLKSNHFWIITFNILLVVSICVAVVILVLKTDHSWFQRIFIVAMSTAFSVYNVGLAIYMRKLNFDMGYVIIDPSRKFYIVDTLVSAAFALYCCYCTFIFFKKSKYRYFVYFYLVSIFILTIPFLFIISPINIREYFNAYVFEYLIAAEFVKAAYQEVGKVTQLSTSILGIAAIIITSTSFMYFMNVNYECNFERVEYDRFLAGQKMPKTQVPYKNFIYEKDDLLLLDSRYWKSYVKLDFWHRLLYWTNK
jgi:hypothetical protein